MAFSLFTFNADFKPLVKAINELADVGRGISAVLERQHPKPVDRSKLRPAGPEAWSVQTEEERVIARAKRESERLLGLKSEE